MIVTKKFGDLSELGGFFYTFDGPGQSKLIDEQEGLIKTRFAFATTNGSQHSAAKILESRGWEKIFTYGNWQNGHTGNQVTFFWKEFPAGATDVKGIDDASRFYSSCSGNFVKDKPGEMRNRWPAGVCLRQREPNPDKKTLAYMKKLHWRFLGTSEVASYFVRAGKPSTEVKAETSYFASMVRKAAKAS